MILRSALGDRTAYAFYLVVALGYRYDRDPMAMKSLVETWLDAMLFPTSVPV